jgi:RNA polymerase subunit RPABC4/transcription elongation factor Spt4
MKSCKQCGREQIRDFDVYCPNCGSKDLQVWTEKNILDAGNYEIAPVGSRIAAALFDLLLLTLIGLLEPGATAQSCRRRGLFLVRALARRQRGKPWETHHASKSP